MTVVIKASKRDRVGKGAARAVRNEKLVPAVVYGGNQGPVSLKVDPRDIYRELQSGVFFNTVFVLDVENEKQKVLPRDVQFHVVRDSIQHVDFYRVRDGDAVKVGIPIEYKGLEDNAAYRMGGRLQVVRHNIELILPSDKIPSKLTVDVSKVKFGGIVRMSNVKVSDGGRPTIMDRDFVLAVMKVPRGATDLEEEQEDEAQDPNK